MSSDTENSLERAHQLSKQQVDDAVSPHELALLFTDNGIEYVLIGGHILGYFSGTPRATVDVDVIVSAAHAARAVKAIQKRFPLLDASDLSENVRFSSRQPAAPFDPERIDVVRASNSLFKTILQKYTTAVRSKGQVVRLPTPEAAVALKFAAAISPYRADDTRPQDRADLVAILRRQSDLRQDVLAELGDLIYPGGGKELVRFVEAVKSGKKAVI
jgi:hypothetical protein